MSSKVKGLVVTLQEDVSEEMADAIAEAISLITQVTHVAKVPVNVDDHINRMRIKTEIISDVGKVLQEKLFGEVK